MSYWDFLKTFYHGQMTCLINTYYIEPKLPMVPANHISVFPCISWKCCQTFKELFYCLWIVFSCLKKIIINAILKILTKGRQSDRVWGMKGKSVPWGAMKNSEPWSWAYKLWCIWPRLPPSTPREVMWPTSWWVQGQLGHTCKYLWRFCHLFVEKKP